MSDDRKKKSSTGGNKKKSFLEKLPSNLPFPKLVRRPDYQLRNVKFKIKHPSNTISVGLLIVLVLLGTFFIYIGGFYYLSNETNVAFYSDPETGDPASIYLNDLDKSTIYEGIAAGALMSVGASGMYLMHLSTQYSYSPSTAAKYLFIGALLVLIAIVSIMSMFIYKFPDMFKEILKELPDRNS